MRKKVSKLIVATLAAVGTLASVAFADAQTMAVYGGTSFNTTVTGVYYSTGVYKTNAVSTASKVTFTTKTTSGGASVGNFEISVVDDTTGGREYVSEHKMLKSMNTYYLYADSINPMEIGKAYDLRICNLGGTGSLRAIGSFQS